ncbi:MAG: helix-hairpin-helix domain-containing protein [Synergistaceae bacterium]|nr:helix-hairpin-helix domain-containing protein [Synergistaceae bacterium]
MKDKKFIFPILGVIAFLVAGFVTMFFKPVEKVKNSEPKQEIQTQIQPQQQPEIKLEPEIKVKDDWYIYVTGEVKNPGVYKVSADSRIFQAVEKAGGFTAKADRNSINMAERLIDGLQIYIAPKVAQQKQTQTQHQNNAIKIPGVQQNYQNYQVQQNVTKTQPKTQTINNNNILGSKVDINNATAKELELIKGVGSVIAQRIIEYRETHGRFNSPDDLIHIKGIGSKTLEKMRPQILIR